MQSLAAYAYNEDEKIQNEVIDPLSEGQPTTSTLEGAVAVTSRVLVTTITSINDEDDTQIIPTNISDIEDLNMHEKRTIKSQNRDDAKGTVHFDLLYHCDSNALPEWSKMPSTHFQDQWNKIATFRIEHPTAPVDHYGCDVSRGNISEIAQRWSVLVSCVISSQTKDLDNYAAMTRLINHIYPEELSAKAMLGLDGEVLESILYPVSFYRNKTKYLHRIATILIEKYEGDIPSELSEVLSLPGVGPKMAHLIMKGCWNLTSGIAVDIHVFRISNRLGWVNATSPEKTMDALMATLPHRLWNQINHLLVGYGQMVCSAINPKCIDCTVNDTCPSADIRSITAKRPRNTKKKIRTSDLSPLPSLSPPLHHSGPNTSQNDLTKKALAIDLPAHTPKRARRSTQSPKRKGVGN